MRSTTLLGQKALTQAGRLFGLLVQCPLPTKHKPSHCLGNHAGSVCVQCHQRSTSTPSHHLLHASRWKPCTWRPSVHLFCIAQTVWTRQTKGQISTGLLKFRRKFHKLTLTRHTSGVESISGDCLMKLMREGQVFAMLSSTQRVVAPSMDQQSKIARVISQSSVCYVTPYLCFDIIASMSSVRIYDVELKH